MTCAHLEAYEIIKS